ncbi:ring-opening amidohydrolase [Neoroseomonas lacus]|uniref:Cyanuric acid amidohydrolase n=1 Tax=Neoroseomonas lacus TaxID=287609 RepID=A0A917K3B5_9PROT|nr:ring-opening amidohydrolase [Neoroseomonas lacus]GGI98454.1 cyanuric acid amidohydrolase [Neoroseomonas lacus]
MPRETFCLRFDMPDPGDAAALRAAIASGRIARDGLRAVLLKTPGNGLTNDHTRTLATREVLAALGPGPAPMMLASGGTEGIAVPHIILLGEMAGGGQPGRGLAIGLGHGPSITPADTAGPAMSRAVAAAVAAAMRTAGVTDAADVVIALVKAPLPSPFAFGGTEEAFAALKGSARAAASLGAAAALGEIPWAQIGDGTTAALHGHRTLVAAGTDVTAPEALVIGQAPGWAGTLRAGATMLVDMLDAPGVAALLASLGLAATPQLTAADAVRLRAVITKGEMPALLRGDRPAALDDSDIHPNRHFRAALGGMIAALTGDGRIFLSGGAEAQTPPGGVLLAIIADTGQEAQE